MLRRTPSIIPVFRNFPLAVGYVIAFSAFALTLAGCSDDGQGGPSLSSLSTPVETKDTTKDTNQGEGAQSADSDPTEIAASGQEDSELSLISPEIESPPNEFAEADLEPPPPTGATAQLNWDASSDPNVQGYFIHYGKRSSGEYGSCSYEETQRVGAPPATITGLEPNTPYFFAISAFSEAESESETPCSNEILVVTSAAQG
ncbi:MAG: hypothetical protein A4E19_17445 [Nitrospira sp. SG-bin1]|nr:MAG: hypothetical protein A4E19_17445 [Nitrospira sp. SG-bin1]